MSRFMVLHFGFEAPTPEMMQAWGSWFGSLGSALVDGGSTFTSAAILTPDGAHELGDDSNPITGYCIIEAADMDAALELVSGVPVIEAVRVYELSEPGPTAA